MQNLNPQIFFIRRRVLASGLVALLVTLLSVSASMLAATTTGPDQRMGQGHRGGFRHQGNSDSFAHFQFGRHSSFGTFGRRGAFGHGGSVGYRGSFAYGPHSPHSYFIGAFGYSVPYRDYRQGGYRSYYRDYGYAGYWSYPLRRPHSRPGERDTGGSEDKAGYDTSARAGAVGERELRAAAVRLVLSIEPAEAVLYLDGRFLGTVDELGQASGILIDPGFHELDIVHPSFLDETLEFTAEPGEVLEVDRRLEPDKS